MFFKKTYNDLGDNFVTYKYPLNISNYNATLEFEARWNIEVNYDFAVVQVSTDKGVTWENLRSSKMKPGTGIQGSRQESGKYGFDGFEPDWIKQECFLDKYTGKIVKLRFGIQSDVHANFDGIHLDNIILRTYEDLTGVSESFDSKTNEIICKPNPVNPNEELYINIYSTNNGVAKQNNISIYNIIGEKIKQVNYTPQSEGVYQISLQINNILPGIYFIVAENGLTNQSGKFVVCP